MRKNKTSYYPKFIFLLAAITLLFLGFMEGDKRGNSTNKQYTLNKTQTSGKQGDAYRFFINNINMPINSVGTIADVNIPEEGTLGRFGNGAFLFSAGFFLSGLTNNNLWAFAQASASLIENMTRGTVESGQNDPDAVIYVVNREDEPFGDSWKDWKDAVDKFDADFYDGDGDGVYNPIDKVGPNGEPLNELWDPWEDMPDLLGDETAWCVYTDGQPGAQRLRFAGVNPQGIEIRQTVFGFASKGALGNMIFIRYRIRNSGLIADVLDSVYFGAWADPDLGVTFNDDLVGVDVSRNAGFTYNGGEDPDPAYGTQIPCFMIDFFSGPKAFIPGVTFIDNSGSGTYEPENGDIALDTAFSFRGQNLGVKIFPGAKNLDVSSFVHYIQSDPLRGDPSDEFEARHYMLGTLKLGEDIDPCNDTWGGVFGGVDCTTIDTRFWYSGDPVTNVGWINTGLVDQRQMTNVGPFQLIKDEEDLEIVVAYVVGQGSDRLNSITVARKIDDGAQFIFDGNFRAPTPPKTLQVETVSGPDFIDFLMPVSDQVSFLDPTDAWDNRFHGINVTAYKTNSTQETVGGSQNLLLHTSFQAENFIQNIFKENPETGGRELLFSESANKLDVEVYSDPERGRIRVRITRDPFTNGDLIKGVPYYFSFTSYAINYDALFPMDETKNFGDEGDYFLSAEGFVAEVENIPKIITTVLADDLYDPPAPFGESNNLMLGPARGQLIYDVVNKSELTGDQYEVTFQIDSTSEDYATFWKLENFTTNKVLKDSATEYLFGSVLIDQELTEGFITKIEDIFPRIDSPYVAETSNPWFNIDVTDVYYVGTDLGTQSRTVPGGGSTLSSSTNEFTKGDQLKSVELRFGDTGKNKAFRYLMGYVGAAPPLRRRNYTYAAGVTTDNPGITIDLDDVGKIGEGIVDVPFTAWVVDDHFGEYQLAVGFLELREAEGGTPDGVWDPGTDLTNGSGEYIFIFNVPYDDIMPSDPADVVGLGRVQTGFQGAELTWANFVGYDIPDDVTVSETERLMASNAYFNILYTMAIERDTTGFDYVDGDKFIIDVDTYAYTLDDVYQFQTTLGGALTDNEERELFNTVNVYPNPLYGFNVATSYDNSPSDEPFVTFSNLPEEITVRVYSLSGQLLRTLTQDNKTSPTSPFLRWDLQNESGLRVASGLYLAIVSSPKYGERVLKFSIIMPEKQIQKF